MVRRVSSRSRSIEARSSSKLWEESELPDSFPGEVRVSTMYRDCAGCVWDSWDVLFSGGGDEPLKARLTFRTVVCIAEYSIRSVISSLWLKTLGKPSFMLRKSVVDDDFSALSLASRSRCPLLDVRLGGMGLIFPRSLAASSSDTLLPLLLRNVWRDSHLVKLLERSLGIGGTLFTIFSSFTSFSKDGSSVPCLATSWLPLSRSAIAVPKTSPLLSWTEYLVVCSAGFSETPLSLCSLSLLSAVVLPNRFPWASSTEYFVVPSVDFSGSQPS